MHTEYFLLSLHFVGQFEVQTQSKPQIFETLRSIGTSAVLKQIMLTRKSSHHENNQKKSENELTFQSCPILPGCAFENVVKKKKQVLCILFMFCTNREILNNGRIHDESRVIH